MNFLKDTNGEVPDISQVPSYLLAADNHNIGNTRGGSLLDPDTWGEKFFNAGKLIATGVLSGANSFYNTGVTVGNWLGSEAELNDTRSWIAGIDDDLGKYYENNTSSADLVGFIAGSIIPGLGGIKVLNAGQSAIKAATATGRIGSNLSRATGLLVPEVDNYIALAAKDILASQSTFTAINQNGIRALMSGVGQNVLEGIAFETAVQATMFKSPILQEQDGFDILKNIAVGGAFQGVIGGAFTAASSLGKIKKLVGIGDRDLKTFAGRELTEEGTAASQKIILLTEDKADSIRRFEAYGSDSAALDDTAFKAASSAHADKIRRVDNDIRAAFHELVGGNKELSNMLADAHLGLSPTEAMQNLLGANQITNLGTLTKLEKAANKTAKAGGVVDETISHSYVKLTGEGVGTVTDVEPVIANIADRVVPKAGQSIKDAVLAEAREYGFRAGQNWSAKDMTKMASHRDAEARYIWADSVMGDIKEGTAINQYDLPVLERALKDNQLNIKIVDDVGGVLKDKFLSASELEQHIVAAKKDVIEHLLLKNAYEGTHETGFATEAIAKIANTKLSWAEGTGWTSDARDFFAWQAAKSDYSNWLKSKGLMSADLGREADTRFLPSYAKVARQAPELLGLDGHIVDGMTWIKQQQSVIRDGINNVVAKHTGDLYTQIPEITDSMLLGANRYGAGAGVVSFANGGYGSLESITQRLGALTKQLKEKYRGQTQVELEGKLFNVLQNQEAAIEFATVNQKVTRSAKQWIRHTEGAGDDAEHFMITKDAAKKFTDKETGELDFDSLFSEAGEDLIQLRKSETVELIDAHIARSGSRTSGMKELRGAQGLEDVKDPNTFRPIRQNPKDYPYFAFVKDPTVTSQGHTTMIWADSEARLSELIGKVPSKYKVVTKRDTEDFYRARNEYEYSRTLHENYINPELKNAGVMSDFFTKTDPKKIVDDILQQHLREDDMLAVEMMRAKNQKAFDWLEDQGDAYTKISASKLGSYSNRIEQSGKNPYLDYIKTALDISKMSEHPWIQGFNKLLDGAVSRVVGNIGDAWNEWKLPHDTASMDKINKLLDQYGMNTGYRDAATDLLVNHTAPKGELTKFVRGANAILSKLTLGLDPLNAVNNFIGANILRGTELKQITDAIKSGNSELAGELARLSKIDLQNGIGSITAPTKLVARAITSFVKDDGTLLTKYKNAGFIKDISEQFKSIMDDFTLTGTESVSELQSRLSNAFKKAKVLTEAGEKYTGNKLAEEMNRFISANVMDQITSLGVKHKLLTEQEAMAYINTFVNRVEGNIIASQRPLMFQGPIGQAVGLFQTYQFNLMQQMFRYVAEGTKKDAAMLLGLQGTFYGIQGLPGFQFINQHIVGTLSGNDKHVDLYDSIYGTSGKEMGDLFVYGLPSNLLRANLYSRGDINPRQVTVIPTNIADIPTVGAFTKFLGSVKETVDKIGLGGNVWQSMLQGLEHNGLSRPLAGLAQTLQAAGPSGQVFSTTSKGSILASNDLMSWATMVRLAGGRPIDEAIVNDGVYRIQAYQQYDRARMKTLGEAIKSTSIMGESPDESQVIKFAEKYAQYGGKQVQFNKYMMNEYKAANTSQAEKISHQLQNPFAQKMQVLMGTGNFTPDSLTGTSTGE